MLTTLSRRKFTIKKGVLAIGALYIVWRLSIGMPILSDSLPEYSGEYAVGTLDLEVPVQRRNVSDVVFKHTGEPAFQLDTVSRSMCEGATSESTALHKHLLIANAFSRYCFRFSTHQ